MHKVVVGTINFSSSPLLVTWQLKLPDRLFSQPQNQRPFPNHIVAKPFFVIFSLSRGGQKSPSLSVLHMGLHLSSLQSGLYQDISWNNITHDVSALAMDTLVRISMHIVPRKTNETCILIKRASMPASIRNRRLPNPDCTETTVMGCVSFTGVPVTDRQYFHNVPTNQSVHYWKRNVTLQVQNKLKFSFTLIFSWNKKAFVCQKITLHRPTQYWQIYILLPSINNQNFSPWTFKTISKNYLDTEPTKGNIMNSKRIAFVSGRFQKRASAEKDRNNADTEKCGDFTLFLDPLPYDAERTENDSELLSIQLERISWVSFPDCTINWK